MTSFEFIAHHEKADDGSYRPSYDFGREDLGASHRVVPETVRHIDGWLRDEDALKLYELASFSEGPVVEIGSFRGKSSVVLASALRDAGSEAPLISVDVDPVALEHARRAVASHDLTDRVVFVRGSARALFRAFPQLRAAVVFVDGDHSFGGVRRDLDALRPQVPNGGLLLFHDYFDARNADPAVPELDVVRALSQSWVADECDFAGVFGCCGLFRRRGEEPGVAGGAAGHLRDRATSRRRCLAPLASHPTPRPFWPGLLRIN